jgi:hypothetical protein
MKHTKARQLQALLLPPPLLLISRNASRGSCAACGGGGRRGPAGRHCYRGGGGGAQCPARAATRRSSAPPPAPPTAARPAAPAPLPEERRRTADSRITITSHVTCADSHCGSWLAVRLCEALAATTHLCHALTTCHRTLQYEVFQASWNRLLTARASSCGGRLLF